MTASSLYNMVDSIFIGQGVGALAISGLAITFPLMNLSTAFGAGVGVGASSLLSVKLGQKDYGAAQNILGNTVMLNIITGVCFSIISLLFLEPILMFFGASAQTLPYAKDYMEIILPATGRRQAPIVYVYDHLHGDNQCHTRPNLHLATRTRHTRSSLRHGAFPAACPDMAVGDVQQKV